MSESPLLIITLEVTLGVEVSPDKEITEVVVLYDALIPTEFAEVAVTCASTPTVIFPKAVVAAPAPIPAP